jgi:hypothetical protein
MLERAAGNNKFRFIAGTERRWGGFDIHVFIGGVSCDKQFDVTWCSKWIRLGGTNAYLDKFDASYVQRYLTEFRNYPHREPFTAHSQAAARSKTEAIGKF